MAVDLVEHGRGADVLDGVLQLHPRHAAEIELLGVGTAVFDDAEENKHEDRCKQRELDADISGLSDQDWLGNAMPLYSS